MSKDDKKQNFKNLVEQIARIYNQQNDKYFSLLTEIQENYKCTEIVSKQIFKLPMQE